MGWEYKSEIELSVSVSTGQAKQDRTVRVSADINILGLVVVVAPWKVAHVPLAAGADDLVVVMQCPKVVLW